MPVKDALSTFTSGGLKGRSASVAGLLFLAGYYTGGQPECMVMNILFGMGCAAVLMTNRPDMIKRAKYKLIHSERVTIAADEKAFKCMGRWGDDINGTAGGYFNTDVPAAAQKAIRAVITKVGGEPDRV